MKKRTEKKIYNILLLDDDSEMNSQIDNLLSGLRVHILNFEIVPKIYRIDIKVDKVAENKWEISSETILSLNNLSHHKFDLILTDYQLTSSEGKKLLWSNESNTNNIFAENENILLTIKNLKSQYEKWLIDSNKSNLISESIFYTTPKVILRSLVHKNEIDILGPINPTRIQVTKSVFPNSDVWAYDTRQEIFSNDEYYDFYTSQKGRNFYRHIVSINYLRIVENEILKHYFLLSRKMIVRKSILNIASFAGFTAIIGIITQFVMSIGISMIQNQDLRGVLMLGLGFMFLILSSMFLSLFFELYSKSIINWVESKES